MKGPENPNAFYDGFALTGRSLRVPVCPGCKAPLNPEETLISEYDHVRGPQTWAEKVMRDWMAQGKPLRKEASP